MMEYLTDLGRLPLPWQLCIWLLLIYFLSTLSMRVVYYWMKPRKGQDAALAVWKKGKKVRFVVIVLLVASIIWGLLGDIL